MKNSITYVFAFFVLFSMNAFSQAENTEDGINWMSFEEAMEASESEPKMWFIDMYTDWCGWCKRMDATTFQDEHIIESINENYYAVKFDAERKDDIVVGDSTYSFIPNGRRGYHALAAQMMNGRLSYPTYVFLNEKREVVTTVPGYKVQTEMLPILEFMAQYDPVSNPTDFQTYMQSFVSPYEEAEESENEE